VTSIAFLCMVSLNVMSHSELSVSETEQFLGPLPLFYTLDPRDAMFRELHYTVDRARHRCRHGVSMIDDWNGVACPHRHSGRRLHLVILAMMNGVVGTFVAARSRRAANSNPKPLACKASALPLSYDPKK
jgi:hypothetical protein